MSSASFKFPSQLVATFIFGLVVGQYLGEIKILCRQFIGKCRRSQFQIGSRRSETINGHSFWKIKGQLLHFALESQVGYNTSLQLLRKASWSLCRRIKDSEGGDKQHLNKSDLFQFIPKQHLEFGSTPFSTTDCARSHSPRIDHQGDWTVHYFVIDFGQNKHVSFLSHSLGCSWSLQLHGGTEAI